MASEVKEGSEGRKERSTMVDHWRNLISSHDVLTNAALPATMFSLPPFIRQPHHDRYSNSASPPPPTDRLPRSHSPASAYDLKPQVPALTKHPMATFTHRHRQHPYPRPQPHLASLIASSTSHPLSRPPHNDNLHAANVSVNTRPPLTPAAPTSHREPPRPADPPAPHPEESVIPSIRVLQCTALHAVHCTTNLHWGAGMHV